MKMRHLAENERVVLEKNDSEAVAGIGEKPGIAVGEVSG